MRLTSEWTERLDEAFGSNGTKGRLGEEFLCQVFESWEWEYNRFEKERSKQVAGIDIEFRDPRWRNFYTCDVKNNMDEYGCFYVHHDWLFKESFKADRVFHVNPDTGWLAWYGVDDMRKYYNEEHSYIKIIPSKTPSFVKRSKYNKK
jgi:hypothetical protein